MKPALFYVMGRRYGRPTLDSLMAVTSIKGGQLYGRDALHGNPTHRRADDMVTVFRTLDDAQIVVKQAQEAFDAHQGAVDQADAARRKALQIQSDAVKSAGWDRALTFTQVMEYLRKASVTLGVGSIDRMQKRFANG